MSLIDWVDMDPFQVQGYDIASIGTLSRRTSQELATPVPINGTDFLVYWPQISFHNGSDGEPADGGDYLPMSRIRISAAGQLSTVWAHADHLTWTNGWLQVMGREIVGNYFVAVVYGKASFSASYALKINSYSLDDGSLADSIPAGVTNYDGFGLSLHAYADGKAWFFWSDDDGAIHDTDNLIGQTLTVGADGSLSLGSRAILDTYHATDSGGFFFFNPNPNPMYPVTLAPGICGLLSWNNQGYAGKIYEIRDAGGRPAVHTSFALPDDPNGDSTNFIKVTGGIAFTWFNDGRHNNTHPAPYVWGRIDWTEAGGFDNYDVIRLVNSGQIALFHEPLDRFIQGAETMLATRNTYLADPYQVQIPLIETTSIGLALYNFDTVPPSLAQANAAANITKVIDSSIAGTGIFGTGVGTDDRDERAAPVGSKWVIVCWPAASGPYCLTARLTAANVPQWPDAYGTSHAAKGSKLRHWKVT